jgi:hypothetical protein
LRLDWSALDAFLAYIEGSLSAPELLEHPAYQAVLRHARIAYGARLSGAELDSAVAGEESPFFGFRNVRANLPRIRDFMAAGRQLQRGWLADAVTSLSAFASRDETAGVTVYPIVGYDAGIGLDGKACLNVNWQIYLERPAEFGYMMIHESTHVILGRCGPLPDLGAERSRSEWYGLFSRMTQDEGFAVYAPLALRLARGHTGDRTHPILEDYAVLSSRADTQRVLADFRETAADLAGGSNLARDEYLEAIFGSERLTYRAGCEILRRAHAAGGPEAVAAAFRIPGEWFVPEMGELVGLRAPQPRRNARPGVRTADRR